MCFEADTEPYSIERDQRMIQNIEAAGVSWHSFVSHTLYVRSAGNTSIHCYIALCDAIAVAHTILTEMFATAHLSRPMHAICVWLVPVSSAYQAH